MAHDDLTRYHAALGWLVGVIAVWVCGTTHADDFVWTGEAGSNDWLDPGNWQNVTPGGPTDGDGVPDLDDTTTFNTDLTITNGDTRDLNVTPGVTLTLEAGALSVFAGSIVNEGTLTFLGDTTTPDNETFAIRGPVSLLGGGELVLTESEDSMITSGRFGNQSQQLTNVDNTIRGTGRILAPLINQSLVRAEGGVLTLDTFAEIDNTAGTIQIAEDGVLDPHDPVVGGTVHGEPGSGIRWGTFRDVTFTGTHTLERLTFGKVNLEGAITNTDTIVFSDDTRAVANQTLAIRGPVTLAGGGEMLMVHPRLSLIEDAGSTADGPAELTNLSHALRGFGTIDVPVVNRGQIRPEDGVMTFNRSLTNAEGEIRIAGDATLHAADLTNESDGTITGSGALASDAPVESHGTIAPGNSTGTLTLDGALTHAAGGDMRLELAGTQPGTFDVLAVSDEVTIEGGTLTATLLDGFQPAADDVFTVLTTGAGITGAFDNVAPNERLVLENGGSFRASYGPESAFDADTLVLSDFVFPGDLNGDGTIDGLDIDPFVQLLVGAAPFNPAGDLNQDGVIDGTDIDPFVRLLTSSGAADATTRAIPEPTAGVLLAFAWLALAHCRTQLTRGPTIPGRRP